MQSQGMVTQRKQYRRTFIREWRKFRSLTIEQLASRIEMTPSGLSMLERGQSGYTQERLEQIAEALGTSAASLLMRNPTKDDAIWSIWENASEAERVQIATIADALKRAAR